MSPHLERMDNNGEWVPVEGTKHNRCSPDEVRIGSREEMIHGILKDTENVREVEDSQGRSCFEKKESRERGISSIESGRGGVTSA